MEKKQVRDYMTHDVVSVENTDTIKDVIHLIKTTHHDGFPVTRDKVVIGYISARDIIGELPSTKVEMRMSRHPITASPDDTVTEVARRIFRTGIQKLPVVHQDNTLAGIISNMDVIRSQIERVTPEKVYNFMRALKTLYEVDSTLKRESVPVSALHPTQSAVHQDELDGRIYELEKHLAEPVIVVKTGYRLILVDGHHRAVAAHKLKQESLDAFVVYLDKEIELGLEKTAHSMGIETLADVKIDKSPERSLVQPTHPTLISAEKKQVQEYMSTDVTCLEASGVVKEVIAAIRKTGHDGFPVLNDGKVVGLIAARDIVGKKASDQIAPLMETLVFRAHPEDSMTDVARKMFRFCIQKMPVVDSDGKFTGILTNADVIRSQIERVTPEKVYEFIQTLKTLYGVEPVLSRGMVEVKKLVPTQGKVYRDEFEGRMYEIEKHLAEPVVVVRRAGKLILIDGHHRAVAASRMGAEQLDAYLIDVNLDSELGIEKTARSQRLWGINDIKILEESRCSIL